MLHGHPGNVTRPVKRAIVRGVNAGLIVTATTDGEHADHSYHYPPLGRWGLGRGRAVDFGLRDIEVGTEHGMQKLRRFQRHEFSRGIHKGAREVYGPLNTRNVRNGAPLRLPEGTALEQMHDGHVHVAP